MDKQQTGMVLDLIDLTYPGKFKTDNPKVLFETWHSILQEYEYTYIMQNLQQHIKGSPYLPSIHDLVTDKKKQEGGRYIPNAQETKLMIEQKEQERHLALTTSCEKPKKEQILAEREKALKTIANAVKRSEQENPYKVSE